MSPTVTDDALAREASGGDERALGKIFRDFHQPLYRYCLAILGNRQDAEDALQETMIKVLGALPGEQRAIALKPWLYRIAHNESIDLLRRRARASRSRRASRPPGEGLAEQVETRQRLRQLIADLGALPERQRGALLMREAGGLDFEEIAAALETSPAVARQTLYEARLGLRQIDAGRDMDCAGRHRSAFRRRSTGSAPPRHPRPSSGLCGLPPVRRGNRLAPGRPGGDLTAPRGRGGGVASRRSRRRRGRGGGRRRRSRSGERRRRVGRGDRGQVGRHGDGAERSGDGRCGRGDRRGGGRQGWPDPYRHRMTRRRRANPRPATAADRRRRRPLLRLPSQARTRRATEPPTQPHGDRSSRPVRWPRQSPIRQRRRRSRQQLQAEAGSAAAGELSRSPGQVRRRTPPWARSRKADTGCRSPRTGNGGGQEIGKRRRQELLLAAVSPAAPSPPAPPPGSSDASDPARASERPSAAAAAVSPPPATGPARQVRRQEARIGPDSGGAGPFLLRTNASVPNGAESGEYGAQS